MSDSGQEQAENEWELAKKSGDGQQCASNE